MKTCALVAASDFNETAFLSFWQQGMLDCVVAVDGGFLHLQKIGCVPDLALGDFDSLGFVPQDVPTQVFPEQKDESDLALAIDWAREQGYERIFVFGAFSGRLDHTLSAIQVLSAAARAGAQVFGVSDTSFISVFLPGQTYCFGAATQSADFLAQPKDCRACSFFALGDQVEGLTIKGLKYEADHVSLSNTQSLCLSNEFIGKPASVDFSRGALLAIWALPAGLPQAFDSIE